MNNSSVPINQDQICLIGISGPSSAGKTTIARRLQQLLPGAQALVLTLDSYYRDLSHLSADHKHNLNFDCPDSMDEQLLFRHLQLLLSGQAVEKPVYDYATHSRRTIGEWVQPAPYVIVEGIFSLSWEQLRTLYQISVFVDAPDEVCFARRLKRDQQERGYSAEFIRNLYERTVRPMYKQYIEPTRAQANLVLSGVEDVNCSVRNILRYLNLDEDAR